MLEYPLLQILVFLSLLFAPPEADRIVINRPDSLVELRRDGANWTMTHKGQSSIVSLAGDTLVTLTDGKEERFPLADHVGPALSHDWAASPKLALHDAATLGKTAAGHLLLTDDRTYPKAHLIQFAKPGDLRVEVHHSVNSPGIYILPAGSTLLDAISAAGGCSRFSLRERTSISRGSGGEKPQTFTINLRKLEESENRHLIVLEDGDIIVVPEIIC